MSQIKKFWHSSLLSCMVSWSGHHSHYRLHTWQSSCTCRSKCPLRLCHLLHSYHLSRHLPNHPWYSHPSRWWTWLFVQVVCSSHSLDPSYPGHFRYPGPFLLAGEEGYQKVVLVGSQHVVERHTWGAEEESSLLSEVMSRCSNLLCCYWKNK